MIVYTETLLKTDNYLRLYCYQLAEVNKLKEVNK